MKDAVLIVDDSEFVREALTSALREDGIVVAAAKNGKEALEILSSGGDEVGAVVLDVSMPILGGKEVLERLKTRTGSLFIVAVGSRDEQEDLQECLRLGATEILTKPLDVETLRNMLRKALATDQRRPLEQ